MKDHPPPPATWPLPPEGGWMGHEHQLPHPGACWRAIPSGPTGACRIRVCLQQDPMRLTSTLQGERRWSRWHFSGLAARENHLGSLKSYPVGPPSPESKLISNVRRLVWLKAPRGSVMQPGLSGTVPVQISRFAGEDTELKRGQGDRVS